MAELSPEELQRVMAGQEGLQEPTARIQTWAERQVDAFAGMWLDNDGCVAGTGPVLVVVALTVDEQDPLAEELRHVAGLGDRLVIARLPYSQAEVRGEIERLVARFMRS